MIHRVSWMRGLMLVSVVGLTACGTMLSPQQQAAKAELDIAARSPCCRDWQQARVQPLPLEAKKFAMNETAEVFMQDGEKSYGVLLKLPQFVKAYGITLSSKTQGTQTDLLVFAPRVKMMNERFEVTRSFSEADLRSRGGNPERTVHINPANAGERYMLIHGAGLKGSYEKKTPVQTTQAIYTGFGVVYWADGKDVTATVRGSPFGEIEVTPEGLVATSQ